MDRQETKEQGFTPMQAIQIKQDKLESGFDWLKWSHKNLATIVLSVMGIGFAIMGVCFAFIFYILADTKQDMQKLDSRLDKIDSRIDKLESGIQDIRILLIQKQAGQDTSQQEAKQAGHKQAGLFNK